MKLKREAAFMLALFMLASVFSCAKNDASEIKANETQNKTTETATETASDQSISAELPEMDFEGGNFRILQVYKGENHIHNSFEYYTEQQNGELLNDTIYERNAKIEEQYNVVIEADGTEFPGNQTQKNVLSGEFLHNIIADMPQELTKNSLSGCFYNIKNLNYVDISKPWWNSRANEAFEVDGKLCLLTGDYVLYEKQRLPIIFFNSSMAKDFGISDLYATVSDGKWTVELMNEYASLVKLDIDGDGSMNSDIDRFGMLEGSYTYIPFLLFGMDNHISKKTADGSYELALTNDKMLSSIDRLGKLLYTDNVAWGEVVTKQWSISPSPAMVFESSRSLFYNEVLQGIRLLDTDIDFGVIPMPKYDEAQENYLTTVQYANSGAIAVPINNNELELTGVILEALAAESRTTTLPAFIEGVLKTKKSPDGESANMLEIVFDNIVYDMFAAFQIGDVERLIYDNIYINHGEGYVSEVTSKQDAIMSAYDNIIETYQGFAE